MNIFKKIRAELRFAEAVRQADNAHKKTGKRYYVLPTEKKGQLIIVDRTNFVKLKNMHYFNLDKISIPRKECYYCTPYSNGYGRLPEDEIKMKRKQYLSVEKC